MNTPDYAKNAISADGSCAPFVYRDAAGIHIGDCDNHEIFETTQQALGIRAAISTFRRRTQQSPERRNPRRTG